jgi:thioredoxin-related protein
MGNRGKNDGEYFERLFGILGQIIVCDLLKQPRPTDLIKPDELFDIEIKGKKYDIKVRTTNFQNKSYYWNSVAEHQIKYNVDGYIFVVYEKEQGIFEIVGYMYKEEFLKKAERHEPKDRSNLNFNAYEIQDNKLYSFEDLYG